MTDELIICEKPAAALKMAQALADGVVSKKSVNTVPYYEISHDGKKIAVGAAVGHLFGLDQRDKEQGYTYPMFDIEWVPSSAVSKASAFTKKYADVIKQLAKEAKDITIATDYDVEGEVIGLNIMRFLCKRKDARRMKFSTLTKEDLVEAYNHAMPTIDWPQAEAGETRHLLDFYYGINLSRALTSAMKRAGTFKVLSSGRVQGPALKTIVERDAEIKAFIPTPYWQIELLGTTPNGPVTAMHETEKFNDKTVADAVMQKVTGATTAAVQAVDSKEFEQQPPHPFDLTTLQTESYRCFGISPQNTLSIAQDLYTSGVISYPRTSSQQLPPAIGFKKIMQQLAQQQAYSAMVQELLLIKDLKPHDGKKTDPAHPAIYPTGVAPKELDPKQQKVYDLVVKRFLATFAKPARRETMTIGLDVKTEPFIARGTRTVAKEWQAFYAPYVTLEEIELPRVVQGDTIKVDSITCHAKETTPPKRYTEASIIKELERRNLGTKATRAAIIETLKSRNYVKGRKALEATELGYKTLDILKQYSPKIIDEELTRNFEERMEMIREGKEHQPEILAHAKTLLMEILTDFKAKEVEIGAQLKQTFGETRHTMQTIGTCPADQGNLILRKGKFGRFIACSNYPNCTKTFPVPSDGGIEATQKTCDACQHPIILLVKSGKRPQELCINPNCPKKAVAEQKIEERKCTVCGTGNMVLRRSMYGAFLGCSNYPKCKSTLRVNADGTVLPPRFPKKEEVKKTETPPSTNPAITAGTARVAAASAKEKKVAKPKKTTKASVPKKTTTKK